MLKLSKHRPLNDRGMALMEVIPLIVALMVFFTFAIGFFGIVHSGVLSSIAARNYAFETLRHRSDYMYLRNTSSSAPVYKSQGYLKDFGYRLHYIVDENASSSAGIGQRHVPGRPIALFRETTEAGAEVSTHTTQIDNMRSDQRNAGVAVSPVWLRINYGLCLNARCDGT